MTVELWLAFTAAAAIMVAIPGPTVMLVVSYALGEGRRSAWATVVGVALGDFTAMTLSLLGLGALLATSAALFTLLKWVGAAYLIYLGIRLWRAEPSVDQGGAGNGGRSHRSMMGHAFAVTALNPKSIVFFVAFLPQFINAGAPLLPQMAVLEATFLILATLNAALYAYLAGRLRGAIRKPSVLKAINRVGGGILIGAGVATAALKRAT
ncbi:LysE family translocator [Rhodospirillaceae bacterium SYSU D60014]|uniref:LysE family translocator n=1 Tax=Virgifigura deserti TaxID=2268457 RepID=UPI000E66CBBD